MDRFFILTFAGNQYNILVSASAAIGLDCQIRAAEVGLTAVSDDAFEKGCRGTTSVRARTTSGENGKSPGRMPIQVLWGGSGGDRNTLFQLFRKDLLKWNYLFRMPRLFHIHILDVRGRQFQSVFEASSHYIE